MGNEQQSPEPFETNSQQADVPRYADPSAETVVPNNPPSTRDGESTVLSSEQSLQSTINAPTTATPTTRTPAAASGTRFRILKPHARGGLGEVFVARDEELNRDVALKEIRGEHAHNKDSRGRFLLEAEITGGLEHPGIVPVYGLGQYPDGRPYYAMRFIQGDSLKEAIARFHSPQNASTSDSERTLELRKLLGRFVDVCQAVSYAHSRGVLHRDLKPGNIMLGKYGETLVVDWGLAKVQSTLPSPSGRWAGGEGEANDATANMLQPTSGDGITPTLMGSALGTPAYMPPEQASGRLDQLGPQSDVYSLGATLYHLLTGKAPFQTQNLEETLQAVQSGTFPHPTKINASVPKSLEAVCLKAMSLKPRDRYSSPQDLADDIERYLADEPVQAFPEPLSVRAKRWVRKHPTLTTTTAAVVLLTAVGLGTFSSILSGKNTQLSELNDELGDRNTQLVQTNADLDQANADLTAANAREVEARTLAQDNEQAAREQSQLALSTLTSVIFDVQRGLNDLPGGGEVRRRLLATSLEKLDDVATEYVEAAAVDLNTLAALLDMGDIILRFGVGDSEEFLPLNDSLYHSSLTANEESAVSLALVFYSRARTIGESLAPEDPGSIDIQLAVATANTRVGDAHEQLGDMQAALACYQRAREIDQRLAELHSANIAIQRGLAVSLDRLGDMHQRLGETARAMEFCERSLEIIEPIAVADVANVDAQRDLAISLGKMGDVHRELHDLEAADEYFGRMHDTLRRLSADYPASSDFQRLLAVSCERLGDVKLKRGDISAARELFEEMVELDELRVAADATDLSAQRGLLIGCQHLGRLQLLFGEGEAALERLEQAIELAESLAELDPTSAQSKRDLGAACESLGDAILDSDGPTKAIPHYERAFAIYEQCAAIDSSDTQAQRDLARGRERLGEANQRLGENEAAREHFLEMLAILEQLGDIDPTNAKAQRDLAIACGFLGNIDLQLGDVSSAVEWFERSLAITTELVDGDDSAEAQRDLAVSLVNMGHALLGRGDSHDALAMFERYDAICQQLASADPLNVQTLWDLSVGSERLGDVHLQLGDSAAALDERIRLANLRGQIVGSEPTNARALRELSRALELLGDMQFALEEWGQARDAFRQSREIRESLEMAGLNNRQHREQLLLCTSKLAEAHWKLSEPSEAVAGFQRCVELAQRLLEDSPGDAIARHNLAFAHYVLARALAAGLEFDSAIENYRACIDLLDRMIASHQEVEVSRQEREVVINELQTIERESRQIQSLLADWDTFISQPGARSRLADRIMFLAKANRFDEIPQSAELLRSLNAENPENLYNAACGYAVCANAIAAAEGEELTPEQQTQRQECIDLALACLRESIAAGNRGFEHMQQDPDLSVLRDLPEFEVLLHMPPVPSLPE